jgi:hypothetical protein
MPKDWDSEKRVNGKPHYRKTVLVLKWENGIFNFQSPFFDQSALKKTKLLTRIHTSNQITFKPY